MPRPRRNASTRAVITGNAGGIGIVNQGAICADSCLTESRAGSAVIMEGKIILQVKYDVNPANRVAT